VPTGRLITPFCTTGWFDWIHSELWLFDDGLLLLRTDIITTYMSRYSPPLSSIPSHRHFDTEYLEAARRSSSWIDSVSLVHARFDSAIITRGVHLESVGGSRRLLWSIAGKPEVPLREAFTSWNVRVEG
jgi:hypothetical protein